MVVAIRSSLRMSTNATAGAHGRAKRAADGLQLKGRETKHTLLGHTKVAR